MFPGLSGGWTIGCTRGILHYQYSQVKVRIVRADAKIRRQKIIDAACALFRSTPDSAVTLEAIAARAGVGIATLYRNFPTRQDLDVACGIQMLTDIGLLISELRANFHADPTKQWEEFVWKLLDLGAWPLAAAIASEDLTREPELAATRRETIQAFQAVLDLAAPAGLVPRDLTPVEFAEEIFVVTRPLGGKLGEHHPDVQPRLVRRLLTAWKATS